MLGPTAPPADRERADWDVPRPSAMCRNLLAAALLHDVDEAACLAGTGLSTADIVSDATEVQAEQELRIVRNVLAQVDDRQRLARDVGMQYNFANTGILGYALLASPTIGDAVNVACRYASLSSSFLHLVRHDTAEGAILEFDNRHLPADVREFMLERDMFAVTNVVPLLVGRLESPAVLTLEMPGIDMPAERLEFPGLIIKIVTDSTRAAVSVPVEILQLAMPAADAPTARECVRRCEELLQARRQRRGTAALVRARLIRDPGRLPSMAAIAGEFCVAERTMHRRLAAEHTSYRALVDEVRVTLASALLDSGLTVEETARQLGYSETAAFTRAFTRISGEPPSRYRHRSG